MEYKFNPEEYGYRYLGEFKYLDVAKYTNGCSDILHYRTNNTFRINKKNYDGSVYNGVYNGIITSSAFANELLLNLGVLESSISRDLVICNIMK